MNKEQATFSKTSLPQCIYCKHLEKNMKCKAFKKGIPNDIIYNKISHEKTFKNDNGITFNLVNELKKEYEDFKKLIFKG